MLLRRVVLDANVLLNTIFIPQSWSRRAVDLLFRCGFDVCVGMLTTAEAVSRAQTIAATHSAARDPRGAISRWLMLSGAFTVDERSVIIPAEFAGHDQHIVQAAKKAGATVLTNDAKLWMLCQANRLSARLPLQCLRELDNDQLGYTIFGVPPMSSPGSVFARLYPGAWGGRRDVGRFTVVDFPGRLKLSYCTRLTAWVADVAGLPSPVLLSGHTSNEGLSTVALSWDLDTGMFLREASVEAPVKVNLPASFSCDLRDGATIGRAVNGQEYWSGSIYALVQNDKPIGRSLWRTLKASPPDLTPNPYDSDRLDAAIRDWASR